MIFCEFGPCFCNQNHCLSSLKVQLDGNLLSPYHLFLFFFFFVLKKNSLQNFKKIALKDLCIYKRTTPPPRETPSKKIQSLQKMLLFLQDVGVGLVSHNFGHFLFIFSFILLLDYSTSVYANQSSFLLWCTIILYELYFVFFSSGLIANVQLIPIV